MGIGNGKTRDEAKAVGLRFEKARLIVEFDDQREVSVPLSRYPTLAKARPSERNAWELLGPAKGFYWKSLDLDLSVQGIMSGLPEILPKPPPRPRRASSRRVLAR